MSGPDDLEVEARALWQEGFREAFGGFQEDVDERWRNLPKRDRGFVLRQARACLCASKLLRDMAEVLAKLCDGIDGSVDKDGNRTRQNIAVNYQRAQAKNLLARYKALTGGQCPECTAPQAAPAEARDTRNLIAIAFCEGVKHATGYKYVTARSSEAAGKYADEISANLLRPAPSPPSAVDIYDAIKHGDDTHKRWLRDALDALFAGLPVPPPYPSVSPAPSPDIKAALEKVEWSGRTREDEPYCPCCFNAPTEGHNDCELDRAIRSLKPCPAPEETP